MRKELAPLAARSCTSLALVVGTCVLAAVCQAQPPERAADALLAIDQQRASVVERVVATWGPALATSSDSVSIDELRTRLLSLRADRLLAASLAGSEEGLREVTGLAASPAVTKATAMPTKALGDIAADVVYTPVTPCRLVETRGTFAAVYQGDGTPSHTPVPFAPNQIRSYTVQGGNGVCLTQLPGGLNLSAVQLQVFGMPTTSASGDIEILPQGASFGSTATMVYVGTIAFNTVSTAARVNTANHQISVQVRGGGANVAIDVVGYFAAPSGTGGQFFRQGGNAFGATAHLGTTDNQPLELYINSQRGLRIEPTADSPNVIGGHPNNSAGAFEGQTIGGGGSSGDCGVIGGTRPCANRTAHHYASVGGGIANWSTGHSATVAGGYGNTASGVSVPTVAGGAYNIASQQGAFVGGGILNEAAGYYSTVPGGYGNLAQGSHSVAVGHGANAVHSNSFVWNGWSSGSAGSFRDNSFQIHGENGLSIEYGSRRADGGGNSWVYFGTGFVNQAIATSTGAFLTIGGVWTNNSDRARKTAFEPVDAHAILDRVVRLPISTWQYTAEDSAIRHIGPMAQDFHAAFGVGSDEKAIPTVDADGVALAAIQGLHQLVQEKDVKIEAQQREMEAQRHRIADLEARVQRVQSLWGELEAVKRSLSRLSGSERLGIPELRGASIVQ